MKQGFIELETAREKKRNFHKKKCKLRGRAHESRSIKIETIKSERFKRNRRHSRYRVTKSRSRSKRNEEHMVEVEVEGVFGVWTVVWFVEFINTYLAFTIMGRPPRGGTSMASCVLLLLPIALPMTRLTVSSTVSGPVGSVVEL